MSGDDLTSVLAQLSQNVPTIETRKGLILTGLQRDFFSLTAKLPVSVDAGYFSRIADLVTRFRKHGQVIWVRSEADPTTILQEHGLDLDESLTVTSCDVSSQLAVEHAPSRSRSTSRKRKSPGADSTVEENKEAASISSANDTPSWTNEVDPELFLSGPSSKKCCLKGSLGAEFADQVRHLLDPADVQLVKQCYSAFNSTSLLLTLRSNFITELFICGCLTNISVCATAVDAAKYGIKITMIDNCLAYRSRARHDAAMQRLSRYMISASVSSERALEMLEKPDTVTIDDSNEFSADDDESDGYSEVGELHTELGQPHDLYSSFQPSSTSVAELNADMRIIPALEVDVDDATQEMAMPLALPIRQGMRWGRGNDSARSGGPSDGAQHESSVEARRSTGKTLCEYSRADASSPRDSTGVKDLITSLAQRRAISVQESSTQIANISKKTGPDQAFQGTRKLTRSTQQGTNRTSERQTSSHSKGKSIMKPLFDTEEELLSNNSSILYHLLPDELSASIFETLLSEMQWERMLHQTGLVPRLVCCQATVQADGSIPVYRHPADKTILSQPWTQTVDKIRREAERHVGHALNHALIQLYRDGNDFISEHSDKTLDIAFGSRIVNVSFGAERTMRLRSKRGANANALAEPRTIHRVRLPHNSMLIMSLETNAEFMHGITADKRRQAERSEGELAFGGQRISLTFRSVATCLSKDHDLIWGQGAIGKTKDDSQAVEIGGEHGQEMLHAFAAENQSSRRDWSAWYGRGYNVLHLT